MPPKIFGWWKRNSPVSCRSCSFSRSSIAGVFGRLRALAQHRHDLARAAQRLVVADGGEVAARGLRQGADRAERVCVH